jgi:hypothetical protein
MSAPSSSRIHIRRLAPAIVVGLVVGFAFVAFFTSALRNPRPSDIKLGVVAPAPTVAHIAGKLDRALPGGFDVRAFRSEDAARRALGNQQLDGVFVPQPSAPQLTLAGGTGSNVNGVLLAALGAAATANGQRLSVTTVAPLPAHDSRGLSSFFVVAGTTLASLVFSAALFFLGGHTGHAPLRLRLALIAGFAAVVGLVVAIDTRFVTHGLGSGFWSVAGITGLLAVAVALTVNAVVRWIGASGIGLGFLALNLFSLPAIGGPLGPEFVPHFYRVVAPALPSYAALTALKGAVYFDDGGTGTPILVLSAWIAGAIIAECAAHLLHRRPPALPVMGTPRQIVEALV